MLYATSVGSNTMGTGSVSFTYLDYANVVNTMNAASEHCQETGRWFMSSYVLNIVRKIRDADGQPLLAPMMAGAPATILGRPWNTTSVMPKSANDNAVSNPFLVYGDFKQGSFFGDRRQLEVAWSEHAAWNGRRSGAAGDGALRVRRGTPGRIRDLQDGRVVSGHNRNTAGGDGGDWPVMAGRLR